MAWSLSSAGLVAPASFSNSGDVNTLDDYEEGNWTPLIMTSHGSGTGTHTINIGRYTKIGRKCDAWFWLNISSVGSMSNYPGVKVSTLPFTPASDSSSGSSTTRGGSSMRNPITNPASNTHDHYLFNNDNPGSANIAYLITNQAGIGYITTGIYAGLFNYIC
jgi:hypothetical protein